LTPQSINKFGGYRVQGKTEAARNYLLESAHALQEAGCFSIVLEAMKSDIAEIISKELKMPTIGIGSGKNTDGQIIVINDIVGLNDEFVPKFVRRYFDMMARIAEVVGKYGEDVRSGDYPNEEESYG
jgi:3-methyl-2-oxobutanoate hydroxymethyltransferase